MIANLHAGQKKAPCSCGLEQRSSDPGRNRTCGHGRRAASGAVSKMSPGLEGIRGTGGTAEDAAVDSKRLNLLAIPRKAGTAPSLLQRLSRLRTARSVRCDSLPEPKPRETLIRGRIAGCPPLPRSSNFEFLRINAGNGQRVTHESVEVEPIEE